MPHMSTTSHNSTEAFYGATEALIASIGKALASCELDDYKVAQVKVQALIVQLDDLVKEGN